METDINHFRKHPERFDALHLAALARRLEEGEHQGDADIENHYFDVALRQWFHHHGLASRDLVAVAEDRQKYRGGSILTELVLWIEPTPLRWGDLALSLWDSYEWGEGVSECRCDQRTAEVVAPLVSDVSARWLLAERGGAARRALHLACEEPSLAAPIVREWRRRDETGAWENESFYRVRQATRFRHAGGR